MINHEIERKWLVSGLPEAKYRKHRRVESFYLAAEEHCEVRVSRRQKIVEGPGGIILGTPKFKITVKTGNGLVRTEQEAEITEQDYYKLRHEAKSLIHKDWYLFPLNGGLELEVHVVDDRWTYAEIEFPSVEAANAFVPLDFLTEHGTEVTGNPDYAMKNYWRKKVGVA